MFGSLGFPEIMLILVLALLLFGPRRLPEIGRTLGKALGEFRRSTTDLKRSIQTEMTLEETGAQQPEVSRRPEAMGGQSDPAPRAPADTAPRGSGPDRSMPEQAATAAAVATPDPAGAATDPPAPTLTTLDVVEPTEAGAESDSSPRETAGEPADRESGS